MSGYVIVINDMGLRHIIKTREYEAEKFAKDYYESFHKFDSDVFIFCSGTVQMAQEIAEFLVERKREDRRTKNEQRKAD